MFGGNGRHSSEVNGCICLYSPSTRTMDFQINNEIRPLVSLLGKMYTILLNVLCFPIIIKGLIKSFFYESATNVILQP